ncbi:MULTISPECIES: DUF3618 domain-containing protein [unclassified Leucobacter]|uniref:DUF3618 domain-containing protein n=1 Tax=unclassified Leucobacter TaxID=2621730 RepID=UPI00165DDC9C|nr:MULTISPECIES: DUF3618 domain-containing protein [unclassified Leucobacter]MBC9927101.1 DUF3618 domain-containing protein [Leucobacter sp. cx-169]
MNDYTSARPSERSLGVAEAAMAREELYTTLAQLRDRLNYAQRVDDAVDDAKARIAETRRSRPLVFAAGCAGVAVAAGLVVWGVARGISRRIN